MKSVQIRSFFLHVFSCIQTEYGDLQSKSPYLVQIHENRDQKKLRIWTRFTQCMHKRIKIENYWFRMYEKISPANLYKSKN